MSQCAVSVKSSNMAGRPIVLDMRHICPVCEVPFPYEWSLKQHIATHAKVIHAQVKNNCCPQCGSVFRRETIYKKHLLKHLKESPYTCMTCGKALPTADQLRKHSYRHVHQERKKPYSCLSCTKSFTSDRLLRLHNVTHTNPNKPHVCKDCSKGFPTSSLLRRHMYTHSGEKPFACSRCAKSFKSRWLLNVHSLTHAPDLTNSSCGHAKKVEAVESLKTHSTSQVGPWSHSCVNCSIEFMREEDLQEHMTTHYINVGSEEGDNYNDVFDSHDSKRASSVLVNQCVCSECNLGFGTADDLKIHSKIHKNNTFHVCSQCEAVFMSPIQLQKHVVAMHMSQKPHICAICQKGFNLETNLAAHIRTHAYEEPNLVHKCTQCGDEFSTQTGWKEHMLTHTGISVEICTFCRKQFKTAGELQNHMYFHTGVKPLRYVCSTCDKRLATEQALKIHTACHLGTYTCIHCEKTFTKRSRLKTHVRTHTMKTHQCTYCGKGFKRLKELKIHTAAHSTERPHLCLQCGQRYVSDAALVKHIRKNHSKWANTFHLPEESEKAQTSARCKQMLYDNPEANEAFTASSFLHTLGGSPLAEEVQAMPLPDEYPFSVSLISSTNEVQEPSRKSHPLCNFNMNKRTCLTKVSLVCYICGKVFKTAHKLRKHETTHPGIKSNYNVVCKRGFEIPLTTMFNFNNEMKASTEKYYSECNITSSQLNGKRDCSSHCEIVPIVRVSSRQSKNINIRIKNKLPKVPIVCSICGAIYKMASKLRKHVLSHTSVNSIPNEQQELVVVHPLVLKSKVTCFSCPQCDSQFKQESFFKKHLFTHLDTSPHTCTMCGQAFVTRSLLLKHMHSHKEKKPYPCPHCDKTFTSSRLMLKHIWVHGDPKKPHKCKHCGKGYAKRTQLRIHTYTHTGERPFACSHCQKSFKHRWLLNIHSTMHSHEAVSAASCKGGPLQPQPVQLCQSENTRREGICTMSHPTASIEDLSAPILDKHRGKMEMPSTADKTDSETFITRSFLQGHNDGACSQEIHDIPESDMCLSAPSIVIFTQHSSENRVKRVPKNAELGKCMSSNQTVSTGKCHYDELSVQLPSGCHNALNISTVVHGGTDADNIVRIPATVDSSVDNIPQQILHNQKLNIAESITTSTISKNMCCDTQSVDNSHRPPAVRQSANLRSILKIRPISLEESMCSLSARTGNATHELQVSTNVNDIDITVLNDTATSTIGGNICMTLPQETITTSKVVNVSVILPQDLMRSDINETEIKVPIEVEQMNASTILMDSSTDDVSVSQILNKMENTANRQVQLSSEELITQSISPISDSNNVVLLQDTLLTSQVHSSSISLSQEDSVSLKVCTDIAILPQEFAISSEGGNLNVTKPLFSSEVETTQCQTPSEVDNYANLSQEPIISSSVTQETASSPTVIQISEPIRMLPVLKDHHCNTHTANISSVSTIGKEIVNQQSLLSKQGDMVTLLQEYIASSKIANITPALPADDVPLAKPGRGSAVLLHNALQCGIEKTCIVKLPHVCPMCGKFFTSQFKLDKHKRVHPYKEWHHSCSQCDRKFLEKADLEKHSSVCHSNTRLKISPKDYTWPYVCSLCGEGFLGSLALRRHSRTHPEDPHACDLKCNECSMTFVTASKLESHMYSHTGVKPHPCPHCAKAYLEKGDLNRHIRTAHKGEKPHLCDVCGRGFARAPDLKSHMHIHTEDRPPARKNANAIKCSQCDKTFANAHRLTLHMYYHTGERPYACLQCDKTYAEVADLTRHVRSAHAGAKPHVCDVCGRGYVQAGTLRNHKYIHTGEKPHGCPQCESSFRTPKELKKHTATAHVIHAGSIDTIEVSEAVLSVLNNWELA